MSMSWVERGSPWLQVTGYRFESLEYGTFRLEQERGLQVELVFPDIQLSVGDGKLRLSERRWA